MKQFLQTFTSLLLVMFCSSVMAQKFQKQPQQAPHRCATMEAIELRLQTDPQYRAWYEQTRKQAEEAVKAYKAALQRGETPPGSTSRTSALTSIVTIPTVVHVVLPNPDIITDADVEYFINRLNLDFSGLNPDSTNGAPFYNVRGHSLIRFCLARKDPNGNFTTGIERRVGSVAIGGGEPQLIKSFASGGLNPWDVTKYYNIWTGLAAGGLLGIAPAIGTGTAASDGVCINYQAFANNPCYTIGAFNLGRTGVHEIGHNFGLYHTFQGGCSATNDWGQLTSPGCQLSAAILALPDDTPAQNTSTSGCPTGTVAAGCASSPNPPGRQYQNYMDYTDDACYSMFSNGQVERMHYLLEFCRPGYLTSDGCQLPAGTAALDASAETIVSPGGSEIIGCAVQNYPVPGCPGNFIPKLKITNRGSTNITSVTVSCTVSGGATGTTSALVPVASLAYGKSTIITLTALPLGLGSNTVTFNITAVNGGTDGVPGNNTVTTNINIAAPPALPFSYNFVPTTPFLPAGWSVFNPNGNNTWVRNNNGNLNAGSAFIDCYNFNLTGQIDEIRTPNATIGVTDTVLVEWDLAHKNFPGFNDSLIVLVSGDCGATFVRTSFARGGAGLATAGSSTANYTVPAAGDWRRQRLAIPTNIAPLNSGTVLVAFRCRNGYGNNIFIDNINVTKKVDRDMLCDQILRPNTEECTPTFAPSVIVRNSGTQTITAYKVGYFIGAGAPVELNITGVNLPAGATATHTFPAITLAPGAGQSFTGYTKDPVTSGGTGDQNPGNDQLNRLFTVRTLFSAPFSQGFEGTQFAPLEWAIFNPNANNTWVRRAPGKLSGFSAFINNYDFNLQGQIDDIRTPPINTAGADSLEVSWDLAHKNFAGFDDILAIGASANCGATFLATGYQKAGATLATAGSSTASYLNPIDSDWRRERVAIGGAALASGNTIVAFRMVNGYGNNVFIDNINFRLKFRRDAAMTTAIRPALECSPNFTPSVRITNDGTEPITAITIVYRIDGGAPVTTTFTGLNLVNGASTVLNLTAVSGLAPGTHSIQIYSTAAALTTTGGTGDLNVLNDTLARPFTVFTTVQAPLVENFEGNFVPTNWGVNNIDLGETWRKANTGFNSNASAQIRNFTYTNANGTVDELISPMISYSNVDSTYLTFDLAALTRNYPGSTIIPMDTLEVLVSRDCGNTTTSVWKKWGGDLQTVNDPNYSNTFEFNPGGRADLWKQIRLNLTRFLPATSNSVQVIIRSKSNGDNNVFVDNINFSTKTLPQRLKQQGYLLFPSPFSTTFTIQHYLVPTDLRYVEVFNARGQLVARRQYGNNGASSSETMDLSNVAAGVYTVKLGYTNKTVVERIVKTN